MDSLSDDRDRQPHEYTTKSHSAWLVLNGLWRLDAAAREYPAAVKDLGDVETTRKRWEIGLQLEVVCILVF